MLNSYPIYNHHHNTPTNSLRRNSLNSPLSLNKYRLNSFTPSTPLILSQPVFEDFNDDYFSPPSTSVISRSDSPRKLIENETPFFSANKDDTSISFLDGFELTNTPLPTLSTPTSILPSAPSPSNIQCVRIIRRTDSAPVSSTTPANQRRVVRVIRLSNATRTPEPPSSSSSSNVYIVRKSDIPPTVHINPAVKHVIAKAALANADENIPTSKFYGSTISIFGIEFTVVSNENDSSDQCASLVQNFPESSSKTTGPSTNKVRTEQERCNILKCSCLDQ